MIRTPQSYPYCTSNFWTLKKKYTVPSVGQDGITLYLPKEDTFLIRDYENFHLKKEVDRTVRSNAGVITDEVVYEMKGWFIETRTDNNNQPEDDMVIEFRITQPWDSATRSYYTLITCTKSSLDYKQRRISPNFFGKKEDILNNINNSKSFIYRTETSSSDEFLFKVGAERTFITGSYSYILQEDISNSVLTLEELAQCLYDKKTTYSSYLSYIFKSNKTDGIQKKLSDYSVEDFKTVLKEALELGGITSEDDVPRYFFEDDVLTIIPYYQAYKISSGLQPQTLTYSGNSTVTYSNGSETKSISNINGAGYLEAPGDGVLKLESIALNNISVEARIENEQQVANGHVHPVVGTVTSSNKIDSDATENKLYTWISGANSSYKYNEIYNGPPRESYVSSLNDEILGKNNMGKENSIYKIKRNTLRDFFTISGLPHVGVDLEQRISESGGGGGVIGTWRNSSLLYTKQQLINKYGEDALNTVTRDSQTLQLSGTKSGLMNIEETGTVGVGTSGKRGAGEGETQPGEDSKDESTPAPLYRVWYPVEEKVDKSLSEDRLKELSDWAKENNFAISVSDSNNFIASKKTYSNDMIQKQVKTGEKLYFNFNYKGETSIIDSDSSYQRQPDLYNYSSYAANQTSSGYFVARKSSDLQKETFYGKKINTTGNYSIVISFWLTGREYYGDYLLSTQFGANTRLYLYSYNGAKQLFIYELRTFSFGDNQNSLQAILPKTTELSLSSTCTFAGWVKDKDKPSENIYTNNIIINKNTDTGLYATYQLYTKKFTKTGSKDAGPITFYPSKTSIIQFKIRKMEAYTRQSNWDAGAGHYPTTLYYSNLGYTYDTEIIEKCVRFSSGSINWSAISRGSTITISKDYADMNFTYVTIQDGSSTETISYGGGWKDIGNGYVEWTTSTAPKYKYEICDIEYYNVEYIPSSYSVYPTLR